MKKLLAIAALALTPGVAAPQNMDARPYGVFRIELPTIHSSENEPIPTIVFYNNDNENEYENVVHITDEGQIIEENSRYLMSQTQKIVFQPEFYQFKPVNISGFFKDCANLEEIVNIECLDTRLVTDMSYLFYNCSKITSLNLSYFETENVTDMSYMFYGCHNLTNLNISTFFPANVWDFTKMFYDCSMLTKLDLSKFITVVDEDKNQLVCHPKCIDMVANCNNLKKLVLSPTLVFAITDSTGMWNEGVTCNAFDNVGDSQNPCRLYLPANDITVTLMGDSENGWADNYLEIANNIFNNEESDGCIYWSGGIFQKGGFWGFDFYSGDEYHLGDANHDNMLSITDITITVNYILRPETANDLFFLDADMNKDGQITIADVMIMVNTLLNTNTEPYISIGTDDEIDTGECDAPQIPLPSDIDANAIQMTVVIPDNNILKEVKTNNPNTLITFKKVAPKQYNIIAFNTKATAFEKDEKISLLFQNLPKEVIFKNIVLSTTDNKLTSINDRIWHKNDTNNIDMINGNEQANDHFFNINGTPTKKDAKGIVIHNGKKYSHQKY